MPRDLVPDDRHLVVHDRAGARLPFSRGIMATSLLATGLPTAEAHRMATLLSEALRADEIQEIEADELVARAHALLAEQQGATVAARWLAWRHAKRVRRPVVISICGAPGVGKSTVATRLAVRLEITRIVTTDTIREVLRTVIPRAVLPELHASSYELVELEATMPFAGFDRQGAAVAAATDAVVGRLCTEQRSTLVEGIHVPPGYLSRTAAAHPTGPVIIERLIIEPDEDTHRERLLHRSLAEPQRGGERSLSHFRVIRAIQDHLVEQARAGGVPIIDPTGLADLTQSIVDEIVHHTAEDADAE
ncbi:MAG TPA: AAA family ATPase [Anaerolineae bacterium]|nr:AAA family ATPase [Anaerolineae bacterium]